MGKAKISLEVIKIMALFESVTGARLKDCVVDNNIAYFIVHPNQSGIAIGRNGANIKKMESLIKKKSIVIEYSEDKLQFIKNVANIHGNLKIESVSENNGVIEIKCNDTQTKSIIIGRGRQNINFIESMIKRHFNISSIVVA